MAGAIPSTSDWTLDTDELIRSATERLPNTRQQHRAIDLQTARRAIQFCFARLAALGINLWTVEIQWSLPLTLAQASYDLPDDTLDVLEVTYLDSAEASPTEIPLNRASRDTYANQPNKAEAGPPALVYLQRGRDGAPNAATLYVWPVPDKTTYALRYSRIRMFRDVGNMLAGVDAPARWMGVLVAGVAYYLGLVTPGLSLDERSALKAIFEDEVGTISPEDRDRSVFAVMPDLSSYYRI